MQFTTEYKPSLGGIYVALEVFQTATFGLVLQLQNSEIKPHYMLIEI